MKYRLGETKEMNVLREMRESLIRQSNKKDQQALEEERWNSFGKAAQDIQESVENGDLKELVANVRRMKNLLRRPSVRRDLARLEQEDNDKEKKETVPKKDAPKGSCKCSECGGTIDGYRECVAGALCPDCALKSRKKSPGEKDQKKAEKKAKKGIPFPPEMMGVGGGGEEPGGEGGEGEAPEEEPPEEEPPEEEPPEKKPPKNQKRKKKKKVSPEKEDEQEVKPGKKSRRQENKRLRRRDYDRALEEFGL